MSIILKAPLVQKLNPTQTVADLTTLLNHLEQIDEKAWFFEFWTGPIDKEPSCGFVGCAGGHACQIPEFKKRGLHLRTEPDDHGFSTWIGWPFLDGESDGEIVKDQYMGYEALAQFFGITEEESKYIFTPDGYANLEGNMPVPLDRVCDNIRRITNHYKELPGVSDPNVLHDSTALPETDGKGGTIQDRRPSQGKDEVVGDTDGKSEKCKEIYHT